MLRQPDSPPVESPGTICTMRRSASIIILFLATLVFARTASGQENFLINPGARSIGLGGAFAAIADDATAAFANPAGLAQILRPEISVELRATASTTGIGAPFEQDADVSGLGFFSFVYPARSWSLALYSHQLASLEFTFDGATPYSYALTVRSYSAAASYTISDKLNIGAGVSSFEADRDSTPVSPRVTDSDWGFNMGVLWDAADHLRLAAFYRQGPSFETSAVRLPLDSTTASTRFSLLDVPDVYGVAAAYQPGGGGLTLGFEADRIGGTSDLRPFESTISSGGTELHFGFEYAILKWKPVVALRAGIWRDSGSTHQITLAPDVQPTVTTGGSTHAAFGFGFAFRKFQLDVGADVADNRVVGSMSMVISF